MPKKDIEVVIGFPLSHEAIMLYAKYSGFKLYPCTPKRKNTKVAKGVLDFNHYVLVSDKKAIRNDFIRYSKNPLTKTGRIPKNEHFSHRNIKRDDPILIKVVNDLKKKAGLFIKIVKIPADVDWRVTDNNCGHEFIEEVHRTWS